LGLGAEPDADDETNVDRSLVRIKSESALDELSYSSPAVDVETRGLEGRTEPIEKPEAMIGLEVGVLDTRPLDESST